MDTEAFIRWALDSARTVDERYTVELLVEQGVGYWNAQRKIVVPYSFEATIERNRERKLNPAYQPQYSEESLTKAVEGLSVIQWWMPSSERPIRNLVALRFLPTLEKVTLSNHFEATDLSPLADLPLLHALSLGYPGSEHSNSACRDFTPLARCTALRELVLSFNFPWPDLTGLDSLPLLENLELSGNLLAMPPGATFPRVRVGRLICMPLAARDVAALPQLPACEFLSLHGAEILDGIEKMPRLRNLTLTGGFESFAPLEALQDLTCLTVTYKGFREAARQPRDVLPLVALPRLHYLYFGHAHIHSLPRDYSPLAEAPALRELIVENCPPVEVEVAALNAGLMPCDDLYLGPEPRAIPPLYMIIGRSTDPFFAVAERRSPGETGMIDLGLRLCEGRWVKRFLQNFISDRIGHADWGRAEVAGLSRMLHIQIESFEVVGKLPEILAATREVIARLRHEYGASFMISLRVPPPPPTPAQQKLEDQFRDEQDEWDHQQRLRDEAEYLERLHRLELKKEEGAEIKPEEFSPSERAPYPEPPWERESDEEDEEEGSGNFAIKKKPEPPPNRWDDDHPLADNYRLYGNLTLEKVWFYPRGRDLAIHLMGREPDEEIPEEKEN